MNDVQQQLIKIIRSIVCEEKFENNITISDPEELYNLSRAHDLVHFVGYGISTHCVENVDSELRRKFIEGYNKAIRRIVILENETLRIKKAFEDNEIDFIPLKGSVIRQLYPEKWMRISADIDILVHPKDLNKAECVLKNELEFIVSNKGAHHDHVTAPSGFHVDLHFTLTEQSGAAKKILDKVWDKCVLVKGTKHEYQMEDEIFYLFHMFHMATHFKKGGCGVRPLLDTWLLNHCVEFNTKNRKTMLMHGGLLTFANTIEQISEAWFSDKNAEDIDGLERYVFNGGVYGANQRIAALQAQKQSRTSYIISRALPPYNSMVRLYPIVKNRPIILPIFWIHRLIKAIMNRQFILAKYEIKKTKEVKVYSQEISELFARLELK